MKISQITLRAISKNLNELELIIRSTPKKQLKDERLELNNLNHANMFLHKLIYEWKWLEVFKNIITGKQKIVENNCEHTEREPVIDRFWKTYYRCTKCWLKIK